MPPARWLSDCRKWHVDSAEKGSLHQTAEKRGGGAAHRPRKDSQNQLHVESRDRFCSAEAGADSVLASRNSPVLFQESPRWVQTGFSIALPPVWWIYPDFTSDIPPRSHNGLPLTPINSVWDGYNKVLQMFGITDTDSALPRGYATDIWCWKVAICTLKRGIYLSGIYPRLHLCELPGNLLELLCLWNDTDGWIVSHFEQKLNGGQFISCATAVKLTATNTWKGFHRWGRSGEFSGF